MRCKKMNGSYVTVTWKLFRVSCTNTNLQCNSNSKAYVPAITVCNQAL